jgi:hypothetical protein
MVEERIAMIWLPPDPAQSAASPPLTKRSVVCNFTAPRKVNSLRDTSEKLGVSLFGLAGSLASEVNLLYDQQ